MAVISIIGTSGVGKSYLVKQLASFNSSPAFFEGEEGTIPQQIFESIFANPNPVGRFEYFIDRYYKNLTAAHRISELGLDVFVDGGVITPYAILQYELPEHHPALRKIISRIDNYEADLTVLIISTPEKIKEQLLRRGRKDEKIEESLSRAIKIQDNMLELAKGRDDVLIIDRTKLSFDEESTLDIINKKIRKAVKKEEI